MTSTLHPAHIDFLAELDAEVPGWENAEWDRAISLLKAFIAANGHARVPQRHVEGGYNLGHWVKRQREVRKDGTLPAARIAELDAIGFIWIINDGNGWQRGIDALRAYIAANGHARVPQSHVEDGFKLGGWVSKQRQVRKDGKLSDGRIAELDALGFIWVIRVLAGDGWQRGIDALRAYIAANGHARVSFRHVEDGFPLGTWVSAQRTARRNSTLSDGRIAELDALGFIWIVRAGNGWQRGTDALRGYIAATGHALVPKSHVEDGFPLGEWVSKQRKARKHSKLSAERIVELDALGFIWDASARTPVGGPTSADPVIRPA